MMRKVMGLGLMVWLAGCSDAIETYDPDMDWERVVAEGVDAPPQDVELEIRSLGVTMLVAISNAPPSKKVWVLKGIAGDGACPARLRGACMSLLEPVPIYTVVTSPDGEALLTLPDFHPGSLEYGYQAVVVNPNDKALMSDVTYPIL